MTDHKRNLYDALSTKFDIGTYEDFESKIDNEEHRKKLYDAVSQTYDIGTYDEYNAKLGYQSDVTADAEDRPSLGETFIKGLGAAGVGTAKTALDLGRMAFNTSVLGGAARMLSGKKIDEDLRDESKPLTRASMKLGEIQEKLSREADPTGGEKGFVDLLSEGKVGMALQKALGSGLESLPMMVAAASGPGALIYGAGMAASSYADETRDNPDIPAWKRGVNALGSAALEMAVERLGGPLKNLFGKAGGEISEDVAKEVLKNVAKDGTENIAKRIIKKIGKEGLEEGGEEVLTSFGNDALGQALDWIDGDNDYGITAQWEQMKEENPDADLGDFARNKAKEYLDSFLGGALSGMQISSVPTATGEFAEASARSTVQARYEHGTKLDYQNMYDSDAAVSEANAAVAAAFTNENGEQILSNEFIESLSADDAYALSRSEDIPSNQRAALFGLAEVKATQEGLNKKLDDRVESQINAQRETIEKVVHNNTVTSGVYNNNRVYIKGGVVNNGAVTLENGENGPVIVIDPITGESTTVRTEEISSPVSQNVDEFTRSMEQTIRQTDFSNREAARNTMSPIAKYKAVKPYAGKKILVDVGNGVTEVLVQKVSPNGDVLIKGKKGDLGGQSFLTLKADTFYDSIYRGDDGNPVVTEAGPEEVEQTEEPPVDETPEAEVSGDEDYREGTYTILINGVPVSVDVTGQDNTADRITYEYTDENGVRRSGGSTIGEFKSAIQQAEGYAPSAQETAPEPNPNVAGETPTESEATAEPEPNASESQPTDSATLAPEDINWDVLFEQDPEAYFAELQNQYGEETLDILNEEIDAAQEELDSLNKKRGKTQNERLENRKKKGVLQKRIETLNGMVARLTASATSETPIESTPVAETPETPETSNNPEPTTEPEPAPQAAEAPVEAEPEPIPVAPNPVANPIDEARKKERQLSLNLAKVGLSPEAKQDLAFKAGKDVADMFATREEYDAYAENAADFGPYNSDFERGVEESFANRQQNVSNPPVNSVPLESEPNGENNGESAQNTEGPDSNTIGTGDNTGSAPASEGVAPQKTPRSGKGKGGKAVASKYPARKGNATQKLLIDTFGFNSVSIPNSRKDTLNSIYDFMMEMSQMLGISPKSIGQGGWLEVASLRSNSSASAQHDLRYRGADTIARASIKFKYDWLTGIAHEWWHSLDHALSYFETGKGIDEATIVSDSRFTGRKETLEAVREVINAIKKSGHPDRIRSFVRSRKDLNYYLSYTEMAARAFDEYINAKFAEGGITIEGVRHAQSQTQPTPEEMAIITPAFDNLFKVLQEKEGKRPGTSVLYQIGEIVDTNVSQEAHQLATQAVLDMLRANGIAIVEATDDIVEQMLRSPELIEKMSQSKSVEEFDAIREKSKEEHGIVAANLSDRILRVTKVPLHNFSGSLAEATEKANEWALENITTTDNPITIHEGTIDEFTYVINKSSVKEFFEGTAFRESEKYVKAAYLSVIGNINEVILNCIETEVHPDYIDKKDGKRDADGRISFDVLIHEYRGVINVDGQPFKIKLIFKETRSTSQDNPIYAYNLETIKLSGVTSEEASNEVAQQTLYAPNSLVSATKLLNGIEKSYDKGKNLLEESYKISKKVGKYEIIQTTQGTVYGWTDGKKIYLTEAGINPNTPIHEYTHLWAKAMMQKNPKGWNSIKQLLKNTPAWNQVISDPNYSSIHNDEDAVASEALSRISGTENAAKMEQMAQQMIDEAKGTMRKAEARGLIQNMRDALNKFWNWVGTNLFGIDKFESVEQVTDRVLFDLLNNTDLGNSIFADSSISLQYDGNTEDAYTANDGGGIQPETEGVSGEVSVSGPLSEERRLYNPEGREVSQDAYTRFNPIHEREGESDNRRNLRETRFFEAFEKLTTDEKVLLYNFLNEYLPKSSGVLKSKTNDFIEPIRAKGNTAFADFVEDFINDELKYREGISAATAAKHGFIVGVSYDVSRLEQIFDAYNNDKYNEALFDRAIKLAKRFGVSIKFATRNEDGSFFAAFGNYNPNDNTITLDANLLTEGNMAELCQTIVHELIHSIVTRSASIMSGRAVDKNNQFIDPQSLPKDVVDGINTLKDVYEAIKDDGDFQDTYGKKDFEEMLSEITDPKFRGLLKAKKLWKKFLHGICQILGIADDSSSETDALTEIESALDKILSAAERGELDRAYASYLGQLAEGYTLEDLQNLASGPVKTMLAQNIMSRTGIDPTKVATQTAAQTYDAAVKNMYQEFQRQFQDAYQPVRIGIDAIQQETGNIPIEDYENYLLLQNQSSSRSRVEIDNFTRKYYSPIVKQINSIIDQIMQSRGWDVKNEERRSQVYKEVINYLIAKHGLERNKYYQATKTRKMKRKEMKPELDQAEQDYNDKVNQINSDTSLTDAERQPQLRDALDEYNAVVQEIKTREVPDIRDYSGLTSLFATDKLDDAEQQAQEYVDNFENAVDPSALWDKINAATDKTLRHSYESGLLSRQQYNDIKAMFDFYIPLRGFDETTAEDVYAYARFEGNKFNPAVATAKGRTSLADDPIAIIMNMAESEIAQGNKNRAKQALYNFILNRPVMGADGIERQNSLMQIEDVWYVKGKDGDGNDIYQIATPDRSKGETWEDFENRMMADPNAVKSKKGKVDVGMRFQKPTNSDAHYIYLKVNGVEKAIYINGDPKIADAINGANAKTLGEGAQKFRDFQRMISSTFTNYSLEFTARNYFRDLIYSHINIGVKESDPEYRKKFRQNWRHNNLRSMVQMLTAYRAGELEGRPLNEDEAAFVEFMNNGGQTGYTLINSVETHKKDLERAIKNMQKGIVNGGVKDSTIFKYTLGGIELLNEASELVTRFAAFKTSRDMGRSINKSIGDAKEVTVNFNTKGAQDGAGAMGWVARYFGWSKYFFNASVQGVQNIKGMADANKLKFCGAVGGMIATGFFMPILTSVIASMLGGDDDENEYWNIPEYERQNNFCVPIGGGKYIKVPLPVGFREVYAIGDMVAALAFDKKFKRDAAQVGMDIANKIAATVLPINPLESPANGLSIMHTVAYTLAPSSTQFIIQELSNTDWKGAPLQKEYTYNQDDPQWMKAYASNPEWMKLLSKWCNEHINLDGDYDGWDWSPEKLDNRLSSMLGGVYSLVKKTGRAVSMIWNEEQRNLSNIPLSGVVLGSGIDNDDRFVTDAYYDMKDYYDENVNFIKRRAKTFGYDLEDVFLKEKGKHHPKMQEIYSNKNFDFMQEWYKGNEELDELDKDIKKQEKKIASGQNGEHQLNKLSKLNDDFMVERRSFVDDMLELD